MPKQKTRKRRTKNYIGCRRWPTILRFIPAMCDFCRFFSPHCIKAQMYKQKKKNEKCGQKIICATCRIKKHELWGIAPLWQYTLEKEARKGIVADPDFAEWKAANPPLPDEELKELES